MHKLFGKKIGMTQIFDEAGRVLGVTVVELKAESKLDDFKAGDLVKVSGKSIGKGFAGVVKRFHDRRGPMTHGSKSHRIPGSIGSGTTPGRVWKGRHMPGRMGGGMVSVRKVKIAQVMADKNLILLLGSAPGKRGNNVTITK